jgi:hypothetical protein
LTKALSGKKQKARREIEERQRQEAEAIKRRTDELQRERDEKVAKVQNEKEARILDLMTKAETLFTQGDLKAALVEVAKALVNDPKNPSARELERTIKEELGTLEPTKKDEKETAAKPRQAKKRLSAQRRITESDVKKPFFSRTLIAAICVGVTRLARYLLSSSRTGSSRKRSRSRLFRGPAPPTSPKRRRSALRSQRKWQGNSSVRRAPGCWATRARMPWFNLPRNPRERYSPSVFRTSSRGACRNRLSALT